MATHLRTWNTYWFVTGGLNWSGWLDCRGRIKVYYEQFPAQNMTRVTINHYIVGKLSDTQYPVYANNMTSSYGARNGSWPSSYSTVTEQSINLGISGGTDKEGYIGSTTHDVYHNADGTCHLYVSGSLYATIVEGYDDHEITGGQSSGFDVELPQISRASTITNNTTSSSRKDFGTRTTFTIARPSSNPTHTLTYKVGSTTYTIGTGITTSKAYTFPTSLINSFPSNATPNIVVTCASSNGTSSSTTVYLRVPVSYVPNCSLAISDTGNVPSAWGAWVKTKSKITGTITASGKSGSTISSYSSSANGSSYNTSTFTTGFLKNAGSQTITSTVTDSRGRTKSASQTINVLDYWTPTVSSYQVARCNSNGTLNSEGTYGKVICTYSIAPINNGTTNLNSKSLVVKYGGVTKTFSLSAYSGTFTASTSQLFSGLSISSNHVFEFYIIDYFNPNGLQFNFTMTPSFTTISYLNGGRGVSIGQIATEEGFNVYMPTKVNNTLEVTGLFSANIFTRYYALTPITTNFSTAGWRATISQYTTEVLPAGTYLIRFGYTYKPTIDNTLNSGTTRLKVDGAEQTGTRGRLTTPTSGYTTSGTIIIVETFDEEGTHTIDADVYPQGKTIEGCQAASITFIRLG